MDKRVCAELIDATTRRDERKLSYRDSSVGHSFTRVDTGSEINKIREPEAVSAWGTRDLEYRTHVLRKHAIQRSGTLSSRHAISCPQSDSFSQYGAGSSCVGKGPKRKESAQKPKVNLSPPQKGGGLSLK